jgi:hypothetical protein
MAVSYHNRSEPATISQHELPMAIRDLAISI